MKNEYHGNPIVTETKRDRKTVHWLVGTVIVILALFGLSKLANRPVSDVSTGITDQTSTTETIPPAAEPRATQPSPRPEAH